MGNLSDHSNWEIYNLYLRQETGAPAERTFLRWISHGTKFAALASGGKFVVLYSVQVEPLTMIALQEPFTFS